MRQVIESKLHKPSVRRFAAQFGQSQPLLTFLPRESGELLDGFRWSHLFVYRSKALLYSRIPQHFITCLEQGIHDFRSEEHTSELQSLMRISYAVFCLKKKKNKKNNN